MMNDNLLEDAINVVKKWLPPISQEERDIFTDGIVTMNTDNSTGWIFLDRLIKTGRKELLDSDVMLAGTGAFYGAMLMCVLQGEVCTKDRVDNLFDFMAMYMIADNFLDDKSISLTDKKKFFKLTRDILSGEYVELDFNNEIENTLIFLKDRYERIIEKSPDSSVYLYEAFHAELISAHVQTKGNVSKDVLQHIAEWKGGSTVQAIQCIMNLPVTNEEYDLGSCIQEADDILDLHDDIELNISTAATLTLEQEYSVDSYVCQSILKIDKLKKYTLFKPILLQAIIIGTLSQPFFSNKIKEKLQPYIYIQPSDSKTYRDTFQNIFCKTIASRIRIIQSSKI